MVIFWKVIVTIFLLYTIAVDGNRARRRRQAQQAPMANLQQLPPNPQILNNHGQQPGQNDIGSPKQGGRQYSPYQGQGYGMQGYGSVQNLNYPYAGAGVGSYQYGYGQYAQPGQGSGLYSGYYNQMPGSSNYYSGYNSGGYGGGGGYGGSGGYNRPGYSNYGSGYYWGAGHKQSVNIFTVLLSSLLSLVIYLVTA